MLVTKEDALEIYGAEAINECGELECTECGHETPVLFNYMSKSSPMYLCENCAVKMARILLQDVLGYQNGGVSIDLTQLLFHGTKDINNHRLPTGIRPCNKPRSDATGLELAAHARNLSDTIHDVKGRHTVKQGTGWTGPAIRRMADKAVQTKRSLFDY